MRFAADLMFILLQHNVLGSDVSPEKLTEVIGSGSDRWTLAEHAYLLQQP